MGLEKQRKSHHSDLSKNQNKPWYAMKMKFVFIILLSLVFILPATATEPDTIWTKSNQDGFQGNALWFTPDGTRLLGDKKCFDAYDGHLIWDRGIGFSRQGFSDDSLYFYTPWYGKMRISDGTTAEDGYIPRFRNLPDFFHDSSLIWKDPYPSDQFMTNDHNLFLLLYNQSKIDVPPYKTYEGMIGLICKYNKQLDSIVQYKPITLEGDTFLIYGYAKPEFYSKANNSLIVSIGLDDFRVKYMNFRQYNANTLDSIGDFKFEFDKYGKVNDMKLSYNNKYLGLATTKGWIIVYDLINNSIYKEWQDGDSISFWVGRLAFSRNDSFVVDASNLTKIWNIQEKTLVHTYNFPYQGYANLDVSSDNMKIIAPNNMITTMLRARWTPVTSTEEENDDIEAIFISPNPANNELKINLDKSYNKYYKIQIFNLEGEKVKELEKDKITSNNQTVIDCSDLSSGVYYIRFESNKISKVLKVIINK
jgi:hypothetical protein